MKINYTIGGILLIIIACIAIYFLCIWTHFAWTETDLEKRPDKMFSLLGWLIIFLIYLGPFGGRKHFTKRRTINLNFRK